jgi:hypothetical protein
MTMRTRLAYGWLAAILIAGLLSTAAVLADEPKTAPPPATSPAPQSGKVVGLILGRTGNDIKVKPEGANEPQVYALAAPGGITDPKVAAAVKGSFPPNVVSFEWKLQAGQRVVTSFRQLQRPERSGVVIGTVMGKSAEGDKTPYVDVKAMGLPYTEQYWLNWVNGQWDKNVSGAIAALNIGDKVKLTWNRDERLRVSRIQVMPKAPATMPATK